MAKFHFVREPFSGPGESPVVRRWELQIDDPATTLMGQKSESRLERGSQTEPKNEQDCYGVSLDRMTPEIIEVLLQLTQLEAEGSEQDKKVLGQILGSPQSLVDGLTR